jgi:hypothetical protein
VSDTVRLDIGTSPAALPIVRMVVGGVGSRLELSLDDLEDVYLALEELLRAAGDFGEGPRYSLVIDIGDEDLTITTGPFRSPLLRERLAPVSGSPATIDLRTLLAHVVESLEVCGGDGDCYSIAFRKTRKVV